MTTQSLWKAEDVIRAVRGKCLHEQSWTADGIAIDSRTVKAGDIFIALVGDNHNGHDHVAAAFTAGAAAAIVAVQPANIPPMAPLIFVDDTSIALENLGRYKRTQSKATMIGVTGSVGKTGSKDMLRLMLSAIGNTYANEGNLNNHLGLPLSLARMPDDVRYGVFELGMNHTGEMSMLSRLLQPHVALITTVEAVHLEFFPSIEAIADAKAEIFYGMKPDSIAVLNQNNPQHGRLVNIARAQGLRKIRSFGLDTGLNGRMLHCATSAEGCAVDAEILGKKINYRLGALGEHIALNSVGALLAAVSAGGDLEACAAALAQYKPSKGRGLVEAVKTPKGAITIIDESYNASPAAIRATIKVLQQLPKQGRRILVLGDMKELGGAAEQLHTELAKDIINAKIDRVFCCGEMMEYMFDALTPPLRGAHAHHNIKLAARLADEIQDGDIIAVKGSHSMHMDQIVDALKALDG